MSKPETKQPKGAPADFAGVVIPNPNNVKPHLDTDPLDEPTRLSGGAKLLLPRSSGNASMNIANPPRNQMEHPVEEHFRPTGPRHSLGRGLPKDHPLLRLSEN